MTYYDVVHNYDEDTLAEFLYRFARDTVSQLEAGLLPDRNEIKKFLEKEKPEWLCADK